MMGKVLLLACSIVSINCADHDQRWELIEWKKVMRERLQPQLLVPVVALDSDKESLTVQEISHLNSILLNGNEEDIVECLAKAYNDKKAHMAKPRHSILDAAIENPKLVKLLKLHARAFVAIAHQRGDYYNSVIHNALEAFYLQYKKRPLTFKKAVTFNSTYFVEKILQDPARQPEVQIAAEDALRSAVAHNSSAVALLLLNKGFKPNSSFIPIVKLAIQACEYNDAAYESLDGLLKAGALDKTDLWNSHYCLSDACTLNLPKAVALLLQHDISPNISLKGETMLHVARTREIGELLVHHGAEMHLLTRECTYENNYTPLEETVAVFKEEYIPYMQFLLEHGSQKEKAIDIAQSALLKTYTELQETMLGGTKEALVACTKKFAEYQQLLIVLATTSPKDVYE